MLKERVITACVLVGVLALVLLAMPYGGFVVAMSVIFTLGAWEWANMAGMEKPVLRMGYTALFAGLFAMLVAMDIQLRTGVVISLLSFALSGWALALWFVMRYPQDTVWHNTPFLVIAGVWLLVPAWLGLLVLQPKVSHSGLIWLVIAIVAAADIGAYFAGRRFGRRKLAVDVSPGKTWEGFWGGTLANLLLAMALGCGLGLSGVALAGCVLAVMLTSAISVLGDLFESMVKRERGIKDSSHLLPGHGGVLDRIDGWTAAIPLFALLYLLFEST